jgi:hypothetical protein
LYIYFYKYTTKYTILYTLNRGIYFMFKFINIHQQFPQKAHMAHAYSAGPSSTYMGSPSHMTGSAGVCPKPCSPSLGCQSCLPRQPSFYEHPFQGMLRHPYFAGNFDYIRNLIRACIPQPILRFVTRN